MNAFSIPSMRRASVAIVLCSSLFCACAVSPAADLEANSDRVVIAAAGVVLIGAVGVLVFAAAVLLVVDSLHRAGLLSFDVQAFLTELGWHIQQALQSSPDREQGRTQAYANVLLDETRLFFMTAEASQVSSLLLDAFASLVARDSTDRNLAEQWQLVSESFRDVHSLLEDPEQVQLRAQSLEAAGFGVLFLGRDTEAVLRDTELFLRSIYFFEAGSNGVSADSKLGDPLETLRRLVRLKDSLEREKKKILAEGESADQAYERHRQETLALIESQLAEINNLIDAVRAKMANDLLAPEEDES
ncbi:MAG: hypothetical protein IPJ88_11505 [Myxococcales bacterium]|nr:MAG: hypothetical protein IPJ88_11505 [Myxococcales bacterium]